MSKWTQEDQAWSERMKMQIAEDEKRRILITRSTEHHIKAWDVAQAAGWHPNEEMLNNSTWQMAFPSKVSLEKYEAWKTFHTEMIKYHDLEAQACPLNVTYHANRVSYHEGQLAWPWKA